MKLLSVLLSVAGISSLVWVCPVSAKQPIGLDDESRGTAVDLLAQRVTRVTEVEVIQTEAGVELVLKTVAGSERLVPLILPEGNDLVIDILDATLAFSIRNGVTELNPAPGIRRITVNKAQENSIRVRITGENQTPSAEIVTGRDDLVLSITPDGTTAEQEPDEEIEVIATGQAEEDDYYVDNATTATRTDTPIKDIPQSIQVDFFDRQRYQVAPVLTWQISDKTELTIEADYSQVNLVEDFGIPAAGTILPNPNGEIPLNRFVGEPDDESETSVFRIGYNLEHSFNDTWQLRSAFKFAKLDSDRISTFPLGLEEDLRTLTRGFSDSSEKDNIYNLDNYIVGEFATGSIQHKLLAGFNLYRRELNNEFIAAFDAAPLDIFDPVYDIPPTNEDILEQDRENLTQSLGLYVQDQIDFTDNFIVLLGGRFDIASQEFDDLVDGSSNFNQEEAFSPRVGVVYQPIEPISLYASFTRSFQVADPSSSISGSVEPERGTQYEIGIKGDISDRLSTTLAFYDLTRTNVETTDPENPEFTIQTGEQRSRGIELDVSGEIVPGWNIIAGYAYTDAEITEDNDLPVGNKLNNVPENAFNFWTTYRIGQGSLSGLGFGLGLFFEGDRQGDLDNSFELPSYTRADAAIFYERDRLRAAVNFRNLFDNEFFVFAASDTRVSSGDPFTVIGSVSFEFYISCSSYSKVSKL